MTPREIAPTVKVETGHIAELANTGQIMALALADKGILEAAQAFSSAISVTAASMSDAEDKILGTNLKSRLT